VGMIDSGKVEREKSSFPGRTGVFSGRGFFLSVLLLFLFSSGISRLEAHPFQAGEKLTYVLKLRGIPLGRQVFEVRDGLRIRGRSTYLLFSSVRSSRFLSFLYYINDELESFADTDTLYSVRSRIRFQEGKHSRNYDVEVDMDSMKVLFEDKNNKKKWTREVSFPILDFVSLIYWLRTQDHTVGETFSIFLIDTGPDSAEVKEVKIQVGEVEQISTYVGTFSAIRYLQASEGNRITVWISQEEGNIPVKFQVSTRLGAITAYLAKIEGRDIGQLG